MPSAGELLRNERLQRNRTIAEIAGKTCISARYLHAIEADDVKQLPGEFFYRAFIRQYAKALDLDDATTNQVIAGAVVIEEPDPVPALNHAYLNSETARSPSRWTPPTGVAVGLLLAVLAGASGLYAWWQNVQSRKEAQTESVSHGPAPTRPAQVPEPSSPAVTQPVPNEAKPGASPATDTTTSAETAKAPDERSAARLQPGISLELQASEPVWVSVSSGGQTAFIGTMQPDHVKQFTLDRDAKLLTENAGALQVKMNGKPLGEIGPRGQIRTVVFTPDNFQILQGKPTSTTEEGDKSSTAGVTLRPGVVEH